MNGQSTKNPAELFKLDGCQHKLTKAAASETYEVQITAKITAEDIESIVVDALECVSTYWVGLDNTTPEWADKPKGLPGFTVRGSAPALRKDRQAVRHRRRRRDVGTHP